MYHYLYYSYLAYKLYEYSGIIEYTGKSVITVYGWIYPPEQIEEDSYLDWILLEDKDSPLLEDLKDDEDKLNES